MEVLANGAELHFKTGTMEGVRALSGFVRQKEGGWHSFSLMSNNFSGDGVAIRRQMFAFVRAYFGGE
jgi:D-alanyl-D-alanine carboxypeptidase